MDKSTFKHLIAILTAVLTPSVYAVTLDFSPSTEPTTPFSVDLTVSGLEGSTSLGIYDLNVSFQTTNVGLTVDDVILGNQLQLPGDDGSPVASSSDIQVENGQVSLAEVSLNDAAILEADQADSFTLATFNFSGESELEITSASLGDQNGDALSVNLPSERDTSAFTAQQNSTRVALANVCASLGTGELSEVKDELRTISCAVSEQGSGRDLQNVAGEETFAPASMATKTTNSQAKSIKTQLSSRRQGVNGFSAQNFKFVQNGELLSLAALGLADAIGGAAGSEDGSLGMSERLGGFINATANFGEIDATSREDGLDFNREEVLLGIDYRLTEQWVAGIAAGYAYHDADFHRSAVVAGGSTQSDSYSGSIYSSYYIDDFYVDGLFSYTRSRYDIRRRVVIEDSGLQAQVNKTARATPDSNQYQGSLGIGHKFYQGGISYSPYARVAYQDLTIDAYQESGTESLDLSVAEQNIESLETVLGAQISYAWSQSFAVLIPHIRAEWHHEFLENERVVETRLVNASIEEGNIDRVRSSRPDRDFASVGVGLDVMFRNSLSGSLTYQTVLGQQNVESHAFTAGVRMAF